jgi:predicted ATP-grasp superfamily ATP-dependent carboligase
MAELRNLLIVGASARAAAQSAHRAGFAVTAIDLFADADLAACARAIRCDDYPRGLLALSREAPPGPWMYTGGLENHPNVVSAISAERPLWGNRAEVLRKVRDPILLYETLSAAGLPAIRATRNMRGLPRDGSWIAKPILGSGGIRVHVFNANSPLLARKLDNAPDYEVKRWYFQRRVSGVAASAVFVAASSRAALLGMSEQLIGRPWTNAGPFQYAGSIGPLVGEELATANALVNQIARIGEVLAAAFRLIGLFGVDGIVDGEHFWPVEVNPRYAASCEIIERLTGINAVAVHAAACERGALPVVNDLQPTNRAAGKLIVFATRESVYSEAAANWVRECNTNVVLPCIADIPDMGTRFTAGQPIATVNAEGETTAEVRRRLIGFSDDLRNRLS